MIYETSPLKALEIPTRQDVNVRLVYSDDLPDSFWSRANRKKECRIVLTETPESIEKAELHVVTWTGGPGTITNYFTLNGEHLPVAEGHDHEVVYSILPVPVSILQQGSNTIELLSDTEHHGIEILLPGPALMIRTRK